ncbi:MAG: Fe-S cluster assembly ATPase SufC [Actinobacteria bacterium]|nr:Fe-S cluster assembly ATPase SufC [Actinomycetota bacterium]
MGAQLTHATRVGAVVVTNRGRSTRPTAVARSRSWCRCRGQATPAWYREVRTTCPWSTTERAKNGMFLGFQYPQEISGVSVLQFLRQALSARKGIDLSILELRLSAMDWMKRLGMDSSFIDRHLNTGFSGGERKRNEIMQMAILEPELAILDETDSGLDIDALRIVAKGIQEVRRDRPALGIVLITHYQRLLDELRPDFVHVLIDGRIVATGGMEIAATLEKSGYESFRN